MTHGEEWYAKKLEIMESHGLDFDNIHTRKPIMPRDEALRYYTLKLRRVWIEMLDAKIKPAHRDRALLIMLGRSA